MPPPVEATSVNADLTVHLHSGVHGGIWLSWEPVDWSAAIVRADIVRAIRLGRERLERLERALAVIVDEPRVAGATGE